MQPSKWQKMWLRFLSQISKTKCLMSYGFKKKFPRRNVSKMAE